VDVATGAGDDLQKMAMFIIFSGALLVFAATNALLSLGYQPATLVALFLSLPLLQQIVWLVICLVPPSLLAVSLLQHCMLIGRRKAGDALAARLRGIRLDVRGLEQAQKDNDDASQYLHRSDPEDAISALQVQVKHAEQAVQLHQQQNQSSNLIARVEEIRQQQKETRDRLGDLIGKRRSLLAQIQTSQDDMQRTMSAIEQDKSGDPIEDRLQKLSEFIGTTNSRCEAIEHSMPGLLELEQKLGALAIRIAPLDEKDNGVIDVLKRSFDVQDRLAATIARLERHEGVSLAERVQQLLDTKGGLEQQVSSILSHFSTIEPIRKDITDLFAKILKQDKDGDTLEDRLQKLSEFIATTNSRCEKIERCMPGLAELVEKLDALAIRVAPLDEKESGVTDVLKALSDARSRLAAKIARLERHEGVCLAERIQQLAQAKAELEEQVSNVLSQFSAIETIHKDITGLFAKLPHAQRLETSFEVVTPISFLPSARTG
jgi:chromosome segregation ATPase